MRKILLLTNNGICLPNCLPTMTFGKLNCKVRLRTDYVKANCREVTKTNFKKRIACVEIHKLFAFNSLGICDTNQDC